MLWDEVREKLSNGQAEDKEEMYKTAGIDEICQAVSQLDPEAEEWEAYTKRLLDSLQVIVEDAAKNQHENIYIVSHGLSIRVILHTLNYKQGYLKIENTSISELIYKAGAFHSFGSVNNTDLLVETIVAE